MKTISALKLIAACFLLTVLLFTVASCYSTTTDEIAFIDGNGLIAIADSSGKHVRQLPNSHKASSLAWSPDIDKC